MKRQNQRSESDFDGLKILYMKFSRYNHISSIKSILYLLLFVLFVFHQEILFEKKDVINGRRSIISFAYKSVIFVSR